jgi:quinol monooxygenase YgiN
MPVVISGEIDLAPEARERALLDAQPLIAAALAEKGCVPHAWTADLGKPGRVHVFEEWETKAGLTAHLSDQACFLMPGHLAAVGIRTSVTPSTASTSSNPSTIRRANPAPTSSPLSEPPPKDPTP